MNLSKEQIAEIVDCIAMSDVVLTNEEEDLVTSKRGMKILLTAKFGQQPGAKEEVGIANCSGDIYAMELHQCLHIGNGNLMRVPGGWIYSFEDRNGGWISTFVPFDNEFQKTEQRG